MPSRLVVLLIGLLLAAVGCEEPSRPSSDICGLGYPKLHCQYFETELTTSQCEDRAVPFVQSPCDPEFAERAQAIDGGAPVCNSSPGVDAAANDAGVKTDHADEWSALPCDVACALLGAQPGTCAPMREVSNAYGRSYTISCQTQVPWRCWDAHAF